VRRALCATGMVLAVALDACGRASTDERFVGFGTETQTLARCTSGGLDLDAARRRFDTASPGINASGASAARVRAAIAAHGGVLIAYAGRRYHSRYLSALTHNWRDAEEPVLAEAIVPSLDPRIIFVHTPVWRPRLPSGIIDRRVDDEFSPWTSPHDDEPVCR